MPDLIVIKEKSIFEFLEAVFNPSTEQVVCNNHVGRRVDFIAIMLFDEGHEIVWFGETMLFLHGMVHEDISVGLYFRVKELTCFVKM